MRRRPPDDTVPIDCPDCHGLGLVPNPTKCPLVREAPSNDNGASVAECGHCEGHGYHYMYEDGSVW